MVLEMNFESIVQALTIASVTGLFVWVFRLQGKIATFVTREDLSNIQKDFQSNFSKLHDELKKVAEDLAYLRGRSEN